MFNCLETACINLTGVETCEYVSWSSCHLTEITHCIVEEDTELQWHGCAEKIISVTKATEPTFKMDQVTCHCLQGDMSTDNTGFPALGYRTFSLARTGGICIQSTTLRESATFKNFTPVSVSFWALENWKHLSLLPAVAVSTLDTALLTHSWETAHGCLKCMSPKNLPSFCWTRLVHVMCGY